MRLMNWLVVFAAGCGTSTVSAPPPALPTPQSAVFTNETTGLSLQYPAAWKSVPDDDEGVVLHVAPADRSGELVVTVPKLPWHPFGILPMGRIKGGYVDDAKKRIPDGVATDVPVSVPGANAARLLITGKSTVDRAVLMTHNDHVIVVVVDSPAKGGADEVFEAAVKSIRFTK